MMVIVVNSGRLGGRGTRRLCVLETHEKMRHDDWIVIPWFATAAHVGRP